MTTQRVLVSGASIAGLATAYWLRTHGYDVTIVEIAPAPRPGGQAVDLRGAGRTVVERMGMLDRARALGLDQRGIRWVDEHGRSRAEMPTDAFDGEGIISEIEILRGDLVDLLFGAVRDDVELIFGDTITGITQDAGGVDVTFRDAEPRRFDLVVGADGLHSVVRSLAICPEQEAVQEFGLYTSWFTTPALAALDGWYEMYNAPGGLVASVRPGRVAGESGKASLSFRTGRGESVSYDRRDRESQLALLEERFAGAGWHTGWLLDAARAAEDFAFDSIGQVRLDSWSRGRVAVVGDAAACPSPITGLGTSVALVGAYVLAGELARADGDHSAAFERYDEVARPYVTNAQEIPGGGGASGYAPMSRTAIWLIQASMRWATRWPLRPMMEKQFSKSTDIALPSY